MEKATLKSTVRKERGKNAAGRLRRAGLIPANLLHESKSTLINVPEAEFTKLLHAGLHQSTLLELEIEGSTEKKNTVFVKEIQRHPVTREVNHIDFYKVTPKKKMLLRIPIETTGVAKGQKTGGALEHFIRVIKVKATPETLIEVIRVDVSDMDVGESVHLKDLPIPKEWDVLLQGNPIVLAVSRSRMAKDDAAAPGAAGTPAATAPAAAAKKS